MQNKLAPKLEMKEVGVDLCFLQWFYKTTHEITEMRAVPHHSGSLSASRHWKCHRVFLLPERKPCLFVPPSRNLLSLYPSDANASCHCRPQTKFAKVMFSHVSVHRGMGDGSLSRVGFCPGGVPLSIGISVQGGLCPGGVYIQEGISVHGGSLSRGSVMETTPVTVTCGRYASYWNAFLLKY